MGNYLSKALKLCTKWDSFYLNILFHLCTFSLFFFLFFLIKELARIQLPLEKRRKWAAGYLQCLADVDWTYENLKKNILYQQLQTVSPIINNNELKLPPPLPSPPQY